MDHHDSIKKGTVGYKQSAVECAASREAEIDFSVELPDGEDGIFEHDYSPVGP